MTLEENTRITAADYDRDTRHYQFDLEGTGIEYEIGDVLATYPQNDMGAINKFFEQLKVSPDQLVNIDRLNENV